MGIMKAIKANKKGFLKKSLIVGGLTGLAFIAIKVFFPGKDEQIEEPVEDAIDVEYEKTYEEDSTDSEG